MFQWNLKNICKKKKLCEKDSNSILGYCILKTCFFDYPLEKKLLGKENK